MSEGKKKPIKLEWQGSIASTEPSTSQRVTLKSEKNETKPAASQANRPLTGNVKIRRESKHRAGHTVSVLFDFTDGQAKNAGALTTLCSELKNKLGCGGTVDANTIVIQSENRERLQQVLEKMGITARLV